MMHETIFLVISGFAFAITVMSSVWTAERAYEDVDALMIASDERTFEAAVRGGFDGRDDQLVTFGEHDEDDRASLRAEASEGLAWPIRQDAYVEKADEDEDGSRTQLDPAMLI